MGYDEDLAARIRALLGAEPDVGERPMFGGLAFLMGDHMTVVVSGSGGWWSAWTTSTPSAADVDLPADPEFRAAFAGYVEWGTRLAVQNSAPDAHPPAATPVPRWGWGVAPPYTS